MKNYFKNKNKIKKPKIFFCESAYLGKEKCKKVCDFCNNPKNCV